MPRLRDEILAAALGPVTAAPPGSASRRFRFGPAFVGFAGHFPGLPIVPAIVQLLAAVTVAEAAAGRPLTLTGVKHARFLLKLAPDQELEVQCRTRPDTGACDVKIAVAAGLAASFTLLLAETEAAP